MDSPCTEDGDIRRVAADYIGMRGPGAVDWLTEQAELAAGKGDAEAAKTWREIAGAAALILKSQSGPIA